MEFFYIDPTGLKFDPSRDEAIEKVDVDDPKDDGVVLEVIAKGYSLSGQVVSPPRVKVGHRTSA